MVLLKEAFYHSLSLCGSRLAPDDVSFKAFFVDHVPLYFEKQHFLVKRRIAESVRSWNDVVVRRNMTSWAFGMALCCHILDFSHTCFTEILLHCLNEKDLVTRLAAALSISERTCS